MDIWVKSVAPRLFLGMVLAGIVYITPGFRLEDGSFPFVYYAMIVGIYAVHQVAVYSMFVSQMAWFAKISDPAVGGTYMTLLNTVTNLGGNWPATLALWAVDPLTSRQCLDDKGQINADNVCRNSVESDACRAQGGTCNTSVEGFYVESWVCCIVGLLWLVWGWKTVRKLQSAEESKWLVVKKNSR
jgi:PAT family acetyl-CoA transporter-like MFS transporter 1